MTNATLNAVWLEPKPTTLEQMLAYDQKATSTLKLHAWGWRWGDYLGDIRSLAWDYDCETTGFVEKHLWKKDVYAQVTGKTSDLVLFYKAYAAIVGNLQDM